MCIRQQVAAQADQRNVKCLDLTPFPFPPHQVIAAIVLITAVAMVHHVQQQAENNFQSSVKSED